mgnify:CR=1 FL=1
MANQTRKFEVIFVHLWMAGEHPAIRHLCYACFLIRIAELSPQERAQATKWVAHRQASLLRRWADELEGKL